YMAVSLGYVGAMMLLAARPIMQYVFWGLFRVGYERPWLATTIPIAVAVTTSLLLAVLPMVAAEKRLARLEQTR
ncbi:MAG: hypothetical protein ACXW2Q_08250, partial [Thermoanaerobaculia bacterium]